MSNPLQSYDSLGDVFLNNAGTALSSFGDSESTQAFFNLGPDGAQTSFEIAHTSSNFSVNFVGPTDQDDELWGIDNVRVTIIPEPSTALLLGVGLIGLLASLRRLKA